MTFGTTLVYKMYSFFVLRASFSLPIEDVYPYDIQTLTKME